MVEVTQDDANNYCRVLRVRRLGKTQQFLMNYIREQGGAHVFIGVGVRGSGWAGYDYEEVKRSLDALTRRGLLRVERRCFYDLMPNAEFSGAKRPLE